MAVGKSNEQLEAEIVELRRRAEESEEALRRSIRRLQQRVLALEKGGD